MGPRAARHAEVHRHGRRGGGAEARGGARRRTSRRRRRRHWVRLGGRLVLLDGAAGTAELAQQLHNGLGLADHCLVGDAACGVA